MNDLIVAVAKERILPGQIGVIDYPNPNLETQFYRIAAFITQDILDTYQQFIPWGFSQDITLDLALRQNFPKEWLDVAVTSPNFYIQLRKIIVPYRLNLMEDTVTQLQKVVEFLCYEIIETTAVRSNFQTLASLSPKWIKLGVDYDPVLKSIIQQHQIIIVNHNKVNSNHFQVYGIQMSIKALKLLRIFIEEYVNRIFQKRSCSSALTIQDVEKYFNNV